MRVLDRGPKRDDRACVEPRRPTGPTTSPSWRERGAVAWAVTASVDKISKRSGCRRIARHILTRATLGPVWTCVVPSPLRLSSNSRMLGRRSLVVDGWEGRDDRIGV